ncbi:hypothetical protein EDD11_004942 [Mortierella claussenii]|nr:hypothetical protein EDD11_004942 [Mortierella claussenii]
MGSKSKSGTSKRATAASEPQDHVAPACKRSKKAQDEIFSTISLSDHATGAVKEVYAVDIDMDTVATVDRTSAIDSHDLEGAEDEDADDIDMQDDHRESSGGESDVEDDEDQELRANAVITHKKEAHTSDRVQKVLTNPEIEAAFRDQYMAQITQAFGDELNTLRETDSLERPHLELLIDSLNQTGRIYSAVEKALWVARDGQ